MATKSHIPTLKIRIQAIQEQYIPTGFFTTMIKEGKSSLAMKALQGPTIDGFMSRGTW